MFDLRHPWFAPLWRRVLVTALLLGWTVVEFVSGAPVWGAIFLALGLWCGWTFFVTWDRGEDE